jgi:acetate kinase
MKNLAKNFSSVPLIAAFETDFHRTIKPEACTYAIPNRWAQDFSIRKWGFHGASHRYIAQRVAELTDNCERIISLHLGGSSSLCAIRNGKSIGTTMGMSPQTGLPQSNRVGDFDPFALPLIMERTEKTLDQVLAVLASESGLTGISGVSGDIRDLESAAEQGNSNAQLALDVYIHETRRHFGGLLVQLGGVDCIAFAGGSGENGWRIRERICQNLSELGIAIDPEKNRNNSGENAIHATASRAEIWIVPTNEEIIVARQAAAVLKG